VHVRLKVLVFALLLNTTKSAVGQWMGKQTGCYADSIIANPNRPTVSNPAHVTQYGVLELEYGWDRLWPEENDGRGHPLKFAGHGIVQNEPIGALAHLQLGRADAMQGDTAKAKAAYQDFLTL